MKGGAHNLSCSLYLSPPLTHSPYLLVSVYHDAKGVNEHDERRLDGNVERLCNTPFFVTGN